MAKWKKRIEGSPAQIGQPYKERGRVQHGSARTKGSGTVLPPQPRSVESMKKPVREPAKPSATGRAYVKKFTTAELKHYEDFFISSVGKKVYDEELAKRKSIEKTPEYQSGYEKGLQEAALGKYSAYSSKSENWKKGYDAGWRKAFKEPKYDEIVLINTEEDITAWEKRRAIMESEAFQIWLSERWNIPPMPKDPYQAYMIDKSLKAKLKTRPEWAQRTNRADFQPIDFPPITKEPPPDITEPAPRTVQAEKSKELLRSRMKVVAGKMDVSEPRLRFTTSYKGRARSFYRSGYAINRRTGQLVQIGEPEIVIGIPRSGKIYPENYATLTHEMGHHKTVVNLKREGGEKAVLYHYRQIRRSDAAKIKSEREAWKQADPYLKEHRPAQKWLKKYAFGTYLGTTPKHGKHD